MTVMRETGLVVVSSPPPDEHLFQLSTWGGHLIEREIKRPCRHPVYLMGMQVAGREYLALSCWTCRDIKLMNLNKQKKSRTFIQYDMITAFKGETMGHMCQGEADRLFVQIIVDAVLELDTSAAAFTKVRRISTGWIHSLCYVPDLHQLLVVSDVSGICAVSCDNNTGVWRIKDFNHSHVLYVPSHDAVLVAHSPYIRIIVLDSGSGSDIQTLKLPDYIHEIKGMCSVNGQIVILSKRVEDVNARISYFSLK